MQDYKYDAILVLGTSTKKDLFKNRVEKAIKLYKRRVAKHIVFSGKWWGGLKTKPGQTEARSMLNYALSLGLKKSDSYLEERSLNTMGNFYFSKRQILGPLSLHRVLVITHSSHLEKVSYLAKKILGSKFSVTLTDDGKQRRKSIKHSSLSDIKKYFDRIHDSNHKKIVSLLRNHPYYRAYKKF